MQFFEVVRCIYHIHCLNTFNTFWLGFLLIHGSSVTNHQRDISLGTIVYYRGRCDHFLNHTQVHLYTHIYCGKSDVNYFRVYAVLSVMLPQVGQIM